MGRGNSVPHGNLKLKQRLSGWAQYEEKAKNLEKNFQRFSSKLKHSKKDVLNETEILNCSRDITLNEINNRTVLDISAIPFEQATTYIQPPTNAANITIYEASAWDRLKQFYEKIFSSLRSLAITQTQEIEVREIERTCKNSLEKMRSLSINMGEKDIKAIQSTIADQMNEIQETFCNILNKIQMIASKSFQQYKLKDVQNTFTSLINSVQEMNVFQMLPSLCLAISRLKMTASVSKLLAVSNRITCYNKRQGFNLLRGSAQYNIKKMREIKLKLILSKKLAISAYQIRILEARALLLWRLAINYFSTNSISNPEASIMTFCLESFTSISSTSSWCGFHLHLHDFLQDATSSLYADFLRYDPSKSTLTSFMPKKGYTLGELVNCKVSEDVKSYEQVELNMENGGIMSSIIHSNSSASVEVSNLYEDSRFNRKTDMPFVTESYKTANLSLLVVPIISNSSCIGLLRIYKKSTRQKFGKKTFHWATSLANTLGIIMPGFTKSIERTEQHHTTLLELESQSTLLKSKLQVIEKIDITMKRIIESQSIDNIATMCEEASAEILCADFTILLYYNKESNTVTNLKNGAIFKDSLLPLEAIKKNKTIEINRNEKKQPKKVMFMPLGDSEEDWKGILLAEKSEKIETDSGKWNENIPRENMEVLIKLLSMCLSRTKELSNYLAVKQEDEQSKAIRRKTEATNAIISKLQKLYELRTMSGLNRIAINASAKYKNFHVS